MLKEEVVGRPPMDKEYKEGIGISLAGLLICMQNDGEIKLPPRGKQVHIVKIQRLQLTYRL